MTYLTTSSHDHGSINFGASSYGGLAYTAASSMGEPSTSRFIHSDCSDAESIAGASQEERPRFITEQNLALYWRRPGLFPRTGGFPVPLLETSDDYGMGIRNRPPENLRFDSAPVRYRSRNLLAGEISKVSGTAIKLWAVNDLSDHKLLLQYDLELEDSRRWKEGRLLRVLNDNSGAAKRLELSQEAMELRAFESGHVEGKVFIRTKRSLILADMSDEKPSFSNAFSSSLRCFTQIPHTEDEIAVVDSAGFLFWGSLGCAFSRAKFETPFREVCATDCPRVLLAITEKQMIQKDLRVSDEYAQVVYAHNPMRPALSILPEEAYDYIGEREMFCHLSTLDVQLNTVILTTTRHHFLIDRRMTNQTLLSMPHSELDGSDYCLTTPSFQDPKTDGRAFSFYALTQVRRPALSHWSVLFHPKEKMWSSLGSKYELDSPRLDVPKFIHSHGGTSPIPNAQLPLYTRAIHYQPIPDFPNRALLFRQMDAGEIWYENVMFDPLPSWDTESNSSEMMTVGNKFGEISLKQQHCSEGQPAPICQYSLKKQSLKQIRRYLREGQSSTGLPAYVRDVDSHRNEPLSSVFQVLCSFVEEVNTTQLPNVNETPANAHPFEGIGEFQPADTSEMEDIEPVEEEPDESKQLSSIVAKMWKKTSDYYEFNRGLGRPIAREEVSDGEISEAAETSIDDNAMDLKGIKKWAE